MTGEGPTPTTVARMFPADSGDLAAKGNQLYTRFRARAKDYFQLNADQFYAVSSR
jgi:hypothetical protein